MTESNLPLSDNKEHFTDNTAIGGMYKNWFLDYASYVILERAVPYIEDGLKPVQRRILHSMYEMEDGRYNKVANIIGNTMKYHPHGDASIGDALVQLGQRDLLIDTQGNWGNIHTGDSAAAPRYIEARLSKFAKDVVFNPKTTVWQLSYDGRNNERLRGGRIRVRALIEKKDKKTLVIRQIPFGTNTTSVIDSILAAVDKGKIKIKKVEDNTSANVEIVIHLHPDASQDPDKAIEALYAFSSCEVSISPNACIIEEGRPRFVNVNEILEISTRNTVDLLRLELEIAKQEKEDEWHYCSLEKIFIEKRIYRSLEECETWEQIIETISSGLKPYLKKLKRPVTYDDMAGLTELKIKRISKFDSKKAEDKIAGIEAELDRINGDLANLKNYAIAYFKELLRKYGKGRERRTQISSFEAIVASKVIANNQKLYVNRVDGFAGFGMRRDEFVCDCSDIDDVLAISGDGKFTVVRIDEKSYVGKDIRHIAIFEKNDDRRVYNLIYQDGPRGDIMVKRFTISGVTREKIYDLTKGSEGSKILFLAVTSVDKPPVVQIQLRPRPKLKNLNIDVNFADVLIKNRSAVGNIVTKFGVAKLRVMNAGVAPTADSPTSASPVTKATPEKKGKDPKSQFKIEF